MAALEQCMGRLRDALQVQPSTSISKKEAEHTELEAILADLTEAQRSADVPLGDRDVPPLVDWAANTPESKALFELVNCGGEGEDNWGCCAKVPIKKGERALTFPLSHMMTTENAKAHPGLRACIKELVVLQHMPTAVLALLLIIESLTENSRWKEYIKALPRTFALPLSYTPEDTKLLSGTTLQFEFYPVFRSAVQLYTMLWFKIDWSKHAKGLGFGRDHFTYQRWVWALCAVTSRQNYLPKSVCVQGESDLRAAYPEDFKDDNTEAQNTGSALSERCLALIPLWDMMNHEDGPICTYFETDTNTIESDAMNDVDAGGEVRMFYGARSNTDLMLHCGFFVKDNAHDVFSMSMIVSKKDRLFKQREGLLAFFKMHPTERLKLGPNKPKDMTGVLVMQRILSMGAATIERYQKNPEQIKNLMDPDVYPNVDEEKHVYTSLIKKVQLLKLQSTSHFEKEIKGTEANITSYIGKNLLAIRAQELRLMDRMIDSFQARLDAINIQND